MENSVVNTHYDLQTLKVFEAIRKHQGKFKPYGDNVMTSLGMISEVFAYELRDRGIFDDRFRYTTVYETRKKWAYTEEAKKFSRRFSIARADLSKIWGSVHANDVLHYMKTRQRVQKIPFFTYLEVKKYNAKFFDVAIELGYGEYAYSKLDTREVKFYHNPLDN